MFDEPLPRQAEPRKLALNEAFFKARLDVGIMPRLAEALHEGKGVVDVSLQFGMDEQKQRIIEGEVTCQAQVICQRCLEPMPITLGSVISLGIVRDEEQAKQLARRLDPLIIGDDQLLDLNTIVEEELLLSLPYINYHDVNDCHGLQHYESASETFVEEEEKRDNPFDVLKQLKKPRSKGSNDSNNTES